MAKERYHTVSLPHKLIQKIDEIIKEGKGHYSSRSDFFKDAARHLLKELKK